MRRKRSPSGHQKQIRAFTIFFGGLAVILFVLILWFLNRPHIASGN
jgi:Flp pilus assembly protein TadB